jgi:hypothetical protein
MRRYLQNFLTKSPLDLIDYQPSSSPYIFAPYKNIDSHIISKTFYTTPTFITGVTAKHSSIALKVRLPFALRDAVVKPFCLYRSQARTINENDRRRTVAAEKYFVSQAVITVGDHKKRLRYYGEITD